MTTEKMVAYALRLPASLKAKLEDAAAANHRSLNSEIVWRLTRTFEAWKK